MSTGSTSTIIFDSLDQTANSSSMANPINNTSLGLNNHIDGNIEDDPKNKDVGSQNDENMNFRNNIKLFSPVEEGLHPLRDLLRQDCTTAPSCI